MNSEWDIKIFTDNFYKYMKLSGKTQKEVANALGVSAPTVHDWLKGKKMPKMHNVQKLADLFGVKLSDLVEAKVTKEAQKNNDIMTDIIVRLRTDKDFFYVVETLNALDKERLSGVMQMLNAFAK